MHRLVRVLFAASGAGLAVAGMLAGPAIAGPAIAAPAAPGHAAARATRLPLSAQQMLADRQLHAKDAQAAGALTGVVQAADGEPLAGICVTAFGTAGARLGVTSATGRYFIAGLRLGGYQLRYASCQNESAYVPDWYGGAAERTKSTTVRVGQTRLQPLAPVTVRTPAEASPFRNVIDTSSPETTARSLAAALGLPSAAARSFREPAGTATVDAKTGGISGRVVAAAGHRPLRGICVEAVQDTQNIANAFAAKVRSNKTGHYQITRVPAGRYFVAFFPGCGNSGNWLIQEYKSNTKPTVIRVRTGKTTTGINAALKLGGEISGTVTSTSGKKLNRICVEPEAVRRNDGILLSAFTYRGAYHLRSVPGGSYKINFGGCDSPFSSYVSTWWRNAPTERTARAVTVRGGRQVTGINGVLPPAGVISGTVTDIAHHPLQGICALPTAQTGSGSGDDFFPGITDAAGHYQVRGLPAGRFQLQFWIGCGDDNGNYVPATTSVTVAPGGRYTRNATLEPGASVSGIVTSLATGMPLSGICVDIWSDTDNYGGDFAVTRADGSYTVSNQMPPGTYYLTFSGGCGNPGNYAQVAYDSPSPYSPAPVKVTAYGQAVTGIDAALPAGARIAGTVTAAGGKRPTGICAAAINGDQVVEYTNTVDGRYSLPFLVPGQYSMAFSAGCGTTAQNKAEQYLVGALFGSTASPAVVAAPAGNTYGINASLVAGGAIAGTIKTSTRAVLPTACVSLTGMSGAAAGFATTAGVDPNHGSYDATELPPGTYSATFRADCYRFNSRYENQWYKDKASPAGATRIRVRAGQTTRGINGALVAGGSIGGTITSGGKPVWGMCVLAQNGSQQADFGESGTDQAGHYLIRGLNSGRYELEIWPCGASSRRYAAELITRTVQVTAPKRTSGVNAITQIGGSVTGQLLGDNPLTPQASLCVVAVAANRALDESVLTRDGGTFTISGLPAGKYYVFLNDESCSQAITDLAPQWYPNAATQQAASTVTVSAAATTTVPATTLAQDGVIAGTVSAAGLGPLPGACVIATSTTPGQPPIYSVSRGNGGYRLIGLIPGRYTVEFSSGCGATGYQPQWWQGKSSPTGRTLVTVSAATTSAGISASLHK